MDKKLSSHEVGLAVACFLTHKTLPVRPRRKKGFKSLFKKGRM